MRLTADTEVHLSVQSSPICCDICQLPVLGQRAVQGDHLLSMHPGCALVYEHLPRLWFEQLHPLTCRMFIVTSDNFCINHIAEVFLLKNDKLCNFPDERIINEVWIQTGFELKGTGLFYFNSLPCNRLAQLGIREFGHLSTTILARIRSPHTTCDSGDTTPIRQNPLPIGITTVHFRPQGS